MLSQWLPYRKHQTDTYCILIETRSNGCHFEKSLCIDPWSHFKVNVNLWSLPSLLYRVIQFRYAKNRQRIIVFIVWTHNIVLPFCFWYRGYCCKHSNYPNFPFTLGLIVLIQCFSQRFFKMAAIWASFNQNAVRIIFFFCSGAID